MHFLVVQMEKCMYIEAMYKYVNLNSEQLTSTLLYAEFSAMDYTLNIVSKCQFSLYLNICGLRTDPGKLFVGVLEKSWIFTARQHSLLC